MDTPAQQMAKRKWSLMSVAERKAHGEAMNAARAQQKASGKPVYSIWTYPAPKQGSAVYSTFDRQDALDRLEEYRDNQPEFRHRIVTTYQIN